MPYEIGLGEAIAQGLAQGVSSYTGLQQQGFQNQTQLQQQNIQNLQQQQAREAQQKQQELQNQQYEAARAEQQRQRDLENSRYGDQEQARKDALARQSKLDGMEQRKARYDQTTRVVAPIVDDYNGQMALYNKNGKQPNLTLYTEAKLRRNALLKGLNNINYVTGEKFDESIGALNQLLGVSTPEDAAPQGPVTQGPNPNSGPNPQMTSPSSAQPGVASPAPTQKDPWEAAAEDETRKESVKKLSVANYGVGTQNYIKLSPAQKQKIQSYLADPENAALSLMDVVPEDIGVNLDTVQGYLLQGNPLGIKNSVSLIKGLVTSHPTLAPVLQQLEGWLIDPQNKEAIDAAGAANKVTLAQADRFLNEPLVERIKGFKPDATQDTPEQIDLKMKRYDAFVVLNGDNKALQPYLTGYDFAGERTKSEQRTGIQKIQAGTIQDAGPRATLDTRTNAVLPVPGDSPDTVNMKKGNAEALLAEIGAIPEGEARAKYGYSKEEAAAWVKSKMPDYANLATKTALGDKLTATSITNEEDKPKKGNFETQIKGINLQPSDGPERIAEKQKNSGNMKSILNALTPEAFKAKYGYSKEEGIALLEASTPDYGYALDTIKNNKSLTDLNLKEVTVYRPLERTIAGLRPADGMTPDQIRANQKAYNTLKADPKYAGDETAQSFFNVNYFESAATAATTTGVLQAAQLLSVKQGPLKEQIAALRPDPSTQSQAVILENEQKFKALSAKHASDPDLAPLFAAGFDFKGQGDAAGQGKEIRDGQVDNLRNTPLKEQIAALRPDPSTQTREAILENGRKFEELKKQNASDPQRASLFEVGYDFEGQATAAGDIKTARTAQLKGIADLPLKEQIAALEPKPGESVETLKAKQTAYESLKSKNPDQASLFTPFDFTGAIDNSTKPERQATLQAELSATLPNAGDGVTKITEKQASYKKLGDDLTALPEDDFRAKYGVGKAQGMSAYSAAAPDFDNIRNTLTNARTVEVGRMGDLVRDRFYSKSTGTYDLKGLKEAIDNNPDPEVQAYLKTNLYGAAYDSLSMASGAGKQDYFTPENRKLALEAGVDPEVVDTLAKSAEQAWTLKTAQQLEGLVQAKMGPVERLNTVQNLITNAYAAPTPELAKQQLDNAEQIYTLMQQLDPSLKGRLDIPAARANVTQLMGMKLSDRKMAVMGDVLSSVQNSPGYLDLAKQSLYRLGFTVSDIKTLRSMEGRGGANKAVDLFANSAPPAYLKMSKDGQSVTAGYTQLVGKAKEMLEKAGYVGPVADGMAHSIADNMVFKAKGVQTQQYQATREWTQRMTEYEAGRKDQAVNVAYRLKRDTAADKRDDRNFEYGKGRDIANDANRDSRAAVSDEQFNRSFLYQQGRAEVTDANTKQNRQDQLDRNGVTDGQYNQNRQDNLNRYAVTDNRYDTEWAAKQYMDRLNAKYSANADSRADAQLVLGQNSDARAEKEIAARLAGENGGVATLNPNQKRIALDGFSKSLNSSMTAATKQMKLMFPNASFDPYGGIKNIGRTNLSAEEKTGLAQYTTMVTGYRKQLNLISKGYGELATNGDLSAGTTQTLFGITQSAQGSPPATTSSAILAAVKAAKPLYVNGKQGFSCAHVAGQIINSYDSSVAPSAAAKGLYDNTLRAGWQQAYKGSSVPANSTFKVGDMIVYQGVGYGSEAARKNNGGMGYHIEIVTGFDAKSGRPLTSGNSGLEPTNHTNLPVFAPQKGANMIVVRKPTVADAGVDAPPASAKPAAAPKNNTAPAAPPSSGVKGVAQIGANQIGSSYLDDAGIQKAFDFVRKSGGPMKKTGNLGSIRSTMAYGPISQGNGTGQPSSDKGFDLYYRAVIAAGAKPTEANQAAEELLKGVGYTVYKIDDYRIKAPDIAAIKTFRGVGMNFKPLTNKTPEEQVLYRKEQGRIALNSLLKNMQSRGYKGDGPALLAAALSPDYAVLFK